MFIVAQFFGVLVIISNVISMQLKEKKNILFMFLLINVFSTINYFLLDGYSGALICLFSIVQLLINNYYEKRKKQIPKMIIVFYIIVSIILGMITFEFFTDIIPIICSILFTLTILQKKEKNLRLVSLFNVLLWIFYGVVSRAYTAAISDLITTISTLIGIYRFDIRGKKILDNTNNN